MIWWLTAVVQLVGAYLVSLRSRSRNISWRSVQNEAFTHTHTPHRRTLDHGQPKDVSLPETLVGDDLEKEVLTAGVMLKREREGRGGERRRGGGVYHTALTEYSSVHTSTVKSTEHPFRSTTLTTLLPVTLSHCAGGGCKREGHQRKIITRTPSDVIMAVMNCCTNLLLPATQVSKLRTKHLLHRKILRACKPSTDEQTIFND